MFQSEITPPELMRPQLRLLRFTRIRPGWPIFLCAVIWMAVCQYWMIRSHFEYPPAKDSWPIGNAEYDLLHNTIAMTIEFLAFLAIIRPWSYEILDTATRAGGLAPIMFVASFYHLFITMNAGKVDEIQLGWAAGMFLGSIGLLFLAAVAGLVKRIVDGQKRRRGDI